MNLFATICSQHRHGPHGYSTAASSALTVIASVVMELLLVEVNDVGADVVQEVLVVRHDKQRLAPVL